MPSSSSERRRALLVIAAAGVAVVLGLYGASWALTFTQSPPQSTVALYSPAMQVATLDPELVEGSAAQLGLVTADDRRVQHAVSLAEHRSAPFLAPSAAGRLDALTLVLPAGGRVYRLENLVDLFPTVFTRLGSGAVLVRLPIVVAPAARLIVDSTQVPALYLASGASGYATIAAVRGDLDFRGDPERRLSVGSYDVALRRPDTDETDGRAYLQVRGGTMSLRYTTVSRLGFAIGRSSGVAWVGKDDSPAHGLADHSTFEHNHFGAYSFDAVGLQIRFSSFLDNTVYGFDPHDATNDSLVAHSVAARNGRHGFIFSRGCLRNEMRDDEAYGNGVAGFVIDDGHVGVDGNPRHSSAVTSDANVLRRVYAHDNGIVGISIEGGSGNRILDSRVENSRYGVWVKNRAVNTTVTGTSVARIEITGIRLYDGTRATSIANTTIEGATVGLADDFAASTSLHGLRVSDARLIGLRLRGDHRADELSAVTVGGVGPRAVQTPEAQLPAAMAAAIDDEAWFTTHPPTSMWNFAVHHANLLAWVPIMLLPALFWLPTRRRRGYRTGDYLHSTAA